MRLARWKWRAGKSRDEWAFMVPDGIYCFNHTIYNLNYSVHERERFDVWFEKYLERQEAANGM